MKKWEANEQICFDYISKTYRFDGVKYKQMGSSDSTKSDIYVESIRNMGSFYIETKSAIAQFAQFVLFPNNERREFVFSSENMFPNTDNSRKIIELMNNNYDYYSCGDGLKVLPTKYDDIYSKWIEDCCRFKNCKFIVSRYPEGNRFVIFPVTELRHYFDISGVYRVKKSGSSDLPQKYEEVVKSRIKRISPLSSVYREGKKYFVSNYSSRNFELCFDDFNVFLSSDSPKPGDLVIRKLSNTYHSNVIFTIKLFGTQRQDDLNLFRMALFNLSNRS
ncbi:MAG: hypothetical protein IKP61_02405 [Spirochaetales bacterium]|nr:hypothetical protein [Spirochaetales bacterium]